MSLLTSSILIDWIRAICPLLLRRITRLGYTFFMLSKRSDRESHRMIDDWCKVVALPNWFLFSTGSSRSVESPSSDLWTSCSCRFILVWENKWAMLRYIDTFWLRYLFIYRTSALQRLIVSRNCRALIGNWAIVVSVWSYSSSISSPSDSLQHLT